MGLGTFFDTVLFSDFKGVGKDCFTLFIDCTGQVVQWQLAYRICGVIQASKVRLIHPSASAQILKGNEQRRGNGP
jgi:hypothetical protein